MSDFAKVRLETRDGEHVADVEIPRFKMLPEVLVWGGRTFSCEYRLSQPIFIYTEVFSYTCTGFIPASREEMVSSIVPHFDVGSEVFVETEPGHRFKATVQEKITTGDKAGYYRVWIAGAPPDLFVPATGLKRIGWSDKPPV